MACFEGESLTCQRGETLVFEDLDFALEPGDCLWLAGPNGSGKSSLLRLMAGLARPIEGRITWNGGDIRREAEAHRRRLRCVGHLDAVKSHLTVTENLAFWADYWGAARTRMAPGLEQLGLGHLATVPARRLSAGQRRRLALARLTLGPAALWLLDEPATALDTAGLRILGDLIAACRKDGGIVVYSSHETLPVADVRRLELMPDRHAAAA
jgi:heme exporter protein A